MRSYLQLVKMSSTILLQNTQTIGALFGITPEKAKFGDGKVSYTFRITYRNLDRTLTNAEVDALHTKLTEKTVSEFGAIIR